MLFSFVLQGSSLVLYSILLLSAACSGRKIGAPAVYKISYVVQPGLDRHQLTECVTMRYQHLESRLSNQASPRAA